MNKITFPLEKGNQGSRVGDLQDALLLLLERSLIFPDDEAARHELSAALSQERQTQIYGDRTAKVVDAFQGQHQIEGDHGRVDETTAKAINVFLRELGVLDDSPAANQQHTIVGQVVQSDHTPFRGLVILYQEDTANSIHLGEDATDPEGRYSIPFVLPDSTEGIKMRVAAYDADGQRRAESILEGPRPVDVANLVVQGEGKVFSVTGKVASETRAGVRGLRVIIVDKNVGGDVMVFETSTNPDGTYHAVFTYAGQKQKPDLQARIMSGERLLGTSAVHYNAINEETLDVIVQHAAGKVLATEHETLTRDLATHFAGNLRDLKETDDQQDVTYLANKTGWDARAVALASLADQFSARTSSPAGDTGIPPAFFYALFRAGLPANDAALYRANSATVAAIWKQGIEQGVVPAQMENNIPAALEQFQTLSARQVLDSPGISGLSSLSEMLAVSLPNADAAQREQFATLQIQHQGDPVKFWDAVQTAFGEPTAKRLRLDGQLGFLTLNNAPLAAKLHAAAGQVPLTEPINLIERGYHNPEKWREIIGDDAVPPEIAGADEPKRRANYADVLATKLRLSYPTATVATMVKNGETPTADGIADKVHSFLMEHHGQFEVGMQPVEQFVTRNQIQLEPEVQREVTRIQRVRQITPSDDAMNALLKQGVDSAFAVVRYDRDEFVKAFRDEVGGETQAALIHAKAQQVHNAVLNIASSYLLASNAPGIGVHSPAQIVNPAPNVPANVGDVIAYPTLEKLFGEMDYCDCDHCRSILSPAAYLVDLLQFLDPDSVRWGQFLAQWHKDHGNAPYPFDDQAVWIAAGQPANTEIPPLQVLLSRRPDLQHLPLTCENTNTPLPYIDLVNETLEYFVANGLNLEDYKGHSTDNSASSEELMANPQFVQDSAYDILAGKGIPAPLLPPTPSLPFHQPLESLRCYFDTFETPLPRLLEGLRKDNAVERADADNYGWRDIWMEELRLSRAEYIRLSDRTLTLQQLYGFTPETTDAEVITHLSNAKAFTRRLNISYGELLDLLRTRFINPNGALIPKLERLGVTLATLKAFKNDVITGQQFDDAIAPDIDAGQYGGDIKAWVKEQTNYDKFMGLVVLADPTGSIDVCSFDALEFRYADPVKLADKVRPFEFIRLLRFIRLWKKLGWSIEQTDKAISALYPTDQAPNDADDLVNLQKLDTGFLALLPRLGILKRVIDSLNLKLKDDLLPLLTCFALLDTYGPSSLYRKLFLNPSLLKQDPVFAENGYGNFLNGPHKLFSHQEALRAALTLTDDEFNRISKVLLFDANTLLTLDNISAIFRRSWLARKLKLSVQEFLLLLEFTAIDPFDPTNLANPPMLRLISLVNRLQTSGIKPSQALYLIWDQDISGRSAPEAGQIDEFARSLRSGFAAVESEFTIVDDPDGQIARARMALVYDNATTDLFFGLLNNTLVSDVPYSHSQPLLEQSILDIAPDRIAYDDFRKRLSFAGVMTITTRDKLKTGVPDAFKVAVDQLYDQNQSIVKPFYARYPELEPFYDAYVLSNDQVEKKRSALLANFLPALKRRHKRQQAVQAISAAAKTDANLAGTILNDVAVLHAAANTPLTALDDLTSLEQAGLSAQFYFRDTATDPINKPSDTEAVLAYTAAGPNKLPGNGGNPISGIWSGYVETPESGFYNIRIEAEASTRVELMLGKTSVALTQDGNLWSNGTALELRAGTLYPILLKVEKVVDTLSVQWQTTGRGWEVIPARYLYSATLRDRLYQTYVRFFKTVSLAGVFKLKANEIAYLAGHPDYQIGGQGWLNSLPVAAKPDKPKSLALFKAFGALLDFTHLKTALGPEDERLLAVFKAPQAATAKPDSLLFTLTRWEPSVCAALLARFDKAYADLVHLETFQRLFDAYSWVAKLGISDTALIAATTNEPTAVIVRNLQAAMRARYAVEDWLNVIKPINDQLRGLQRDVLVSYILHQLRANPTSAHIDTPDKLFEYFLKDVLMEPCMQTSRIRHCLSSVQLFIERCLMNLEPRVSSSAINAKQWEWMKRYRVWEANRKVFLWPENWLEPELRDDQSPFFKETISELLQSDITEDLAAGALLNYLGKLDEVEKLEPCGIHYVENNPGTADDIAHVVTRTAGANRKYYSRRCEYGYWTPWEQIKLDIEDNPVIPVVWKNRLFLFWLRILKQVPQDGQKPLDTTLDRPLADIKVSQVNTNPSPMMVQAMLCWSEYYNGKWQPTKTSDVNKPVSLGKFGVDQFDRSKLQLSTELDSDALIITIGKAGDPIFRLYNTHSLPLSSDIGRLSYDSKVSRSIYSFDNKLKISYDRGDGHLDVDGYVQGTILDRPVLQNNLEDQVISPNHDLQNPWSAPFFYQDSRHVFYVTTTEKPVMIQEYQSYGDMNSSPHWQEGIKDIPPLVLQTAPHLPDRIGPVIREQYHGIVDPAPIKRFITEDAYIKQALGTISTVRFGEKKMGPAGAIVQQH
jgi:hypothetical protein